MKKNNLFFFVLAIFLPLLIIFRNFFIPGALVWGDAPYFFAENLKELFNLPFIWDFRNNNFGADQSQVLWLYLPTFIAGFLGSVLHINFDFLIRIIFYFPALIMAIFGSYSFLSFYSKDFKVKLLGVFLYVFNTYFLLVIDGGQIGVALAYGLFPLVVYSFLKTTKLKSLNVFILFLISLFLLSNIDLRVMLLALGFCFLILLENILINKNFRIFYESLLTLLISSILVFLFDSFWTLGFLDYIKNGNTFLVGQNNLSFVTILNSFYLFQPHFPLNEFGKVVMTPFYFGLLPLLLFGWAFADKLKKQNLFFGLLFLILVFLAKGNSDPYPEVYNFFLNKVPLGSAFRDSTKFYIPLLLISSLLLVKSLESILLFFKKGRLVLLFKVLIYLNIVINPVYFNKLTGVLGQKIEVESLSKANELVRNEKGFFRTVWFNERPSLGYSDWNKPALSADSLVDLRPFATMSDGDFDRFNYLHSKFLPQWFELLGIKYVFVPGNLRKKTWSANDYKEKKLFLNFIDSLGEFKKINNIEPPAYVFNGNTQSHIFGQKKMFVVLGGDDIYEKLNKRGGFNLSAQSFLFPEDGKWNLNQLDTLPKDSLSIIYDHKEKTDLLMSFLTDKMLGYADAELNQWGKSGQYFNYKATLLEKGLRIYEFDFGKGVSYSTVKNEFLSFNLKIPKKGQYLIATRYTNSSDSAGIKMKINGFEKNILNTEPEHFKWDISKPFKFEEGMVTVDFINRGGLVVINSILIINKDDYENLDKKVEVINSKFESLQINNDQDFEKIALEKEPVAINYQMINPTKYQLEVPAGINWIVFSDNFSKDWRIKGRDALPVYSFLNGFNISSESGNLELFYTPQKVVNKGILLSVGAGVLFIVLTWILRKKYWK